VQHEVIFIVTLICRWCLEQTFLVEALEPLLRLDCLLPINNTNHQLTIKVLWN